MGRFWNIPPETASNTEYGDITETRVERLKNNITLRRPHNKHKKTPVLSDKMKVYSNQSVCCLHDAS